MSTRERDIVPGQHDSAVRWSTSEVRPGERFDAWTGIISETFVPLTATPLGDLAEFTGRVENHRYGALQVTTVSAASQRVRRTRSLIGRTAGEYLIASIPLSGSGVVEQDGRAAVLEPSSIVFYDSTRPYTLTFERAFEQVSVHLPMEALRERGVPLDALRTRTACDLGSGGPGSVASSYFASLARLQRHDPLAAAALSVHGEGLVASVLALAARPSAPVPDDHELAFARLQAYLANTYVDPDLDSGRAAAACHVSRRQLFRILAEHGTTFTDELRRLRVENARRMLVTDARRTVSSIATACGFALPSHFYRTFKAATGMTPAEYRDAAYGVAAGGLARPGTDVARDAMS
ncbi:helix-turn-helix domain-containing protein [Actinoplanes subtropicus]|uniref:AraC-like ligand-binding domain-containing protein n=1 Tax=Actinoplanes subtropicus TaxID=543632 RepID=UPI0014706F65|nr:helix-turn-helix domain-containing protein [Actinoplanes subtropicus]